MIQQEMQVACDICNQEILQSSFILHQVHCARFLTKCLDCGLQYPKKLYEKHLEDYHETQQCENCNKTFEFWMLEAHEKSCKPMECKYCQIKFKTGQDSLEDHEYYCGARTIKCETCLIYVTKKDLFNNMHKCDIKRERNQKRKLEVEESDYEGIASKQVAKKGIKRRKIAIRKKNVKQSVTSQDFSESSQSSKSESESEYFSANESSASSY